MKLNMPKNWFEQMGDKEENYEVGAGVPEQPQMNVDAAPVPSVTDIDWNKYEP